MRISVFNSKELQATIALLKGADRSIAKEIRRASKDMAGPAWAKATAERAQTRLERIVLANTARVAVSDQNISLRAASIGRALPGGLSIKDQYHAVEFGADRSKQKTYTSKSRRGRSFTVDNRHTQRQLTPRTKKGNVIYPAAAEMIPRIASLHIQTVMRTFAEIIERGTNG